jgi:hypothetical protein
VSATPLWKKLGLRPGGRLLTRHAPPRWRPPDLPEGAAARALTSRTRAGGAETVILAFFRERAALAAELAALGERIHPDGALWIAWPRRAAGHVSDIREQDIRDLALPLGLVDVKVAALEQDWSGLRLVWRVERRHAPPAARG